MRAVFLCLVVLCCIGCGVPTRTVPGQNPLVYDPQEVASAEKIAIFIPGALSSIDIFAASIGWEDAGYARTFYRYPGLDDLPNDHIVAPSRVAAHLVDFAAAYPDKDIALVGYSTGGPIALLAASQIKGPRQVSVAAMSTAVEYGGGLATVARGVQDIARAAWAVGSLQRQVVWKRFWAGLLYGPDAFDDPAYDARLERDIAAGEDVIVNLDLPIALAHTLGLPGFELPDDLDLTGVNVAFFVGLNDRVFSTAQTRNFSRKIGGVTIYGYREQGHLLFFTRPDVFDDMLAFVENGAVGANFREN